MTVQRIRELQRGISIMKQKMFIDDNIAVWTLGERSKCDIHINEWSIPTGESYLDLGIRIYNSSKINGFYVYISYSITTDEVEDLSELLSSEKVARGIFNTPCKIKYSTNHPFIELEISGSKQSVIKLSFIEFTTEKTGDGTVLFFPLDAIRNQEIQNVIYIRFRIPHKSINKLYHAKNGDIGDLFSTPIVAEQYDYALKINEFRSIPLKTADTLCQNTLVIRKILVVMAISRKYFIDDQECYKVRLLERDLYNSYVPNKFDCGNSIVYQWEKKQMDKCTFSFKITSEGISKKSLIMYILILVAVSLTTNALWDGIKWGFTLIVNIFK